MSRKRSFCHTCGKYDIGLPMNKSYMNYRKNTTIKAYVPTEPDYWLCLLLLKVTVH